MNDQVSDADLPRDPDGQVAGWLRRAWWEYVHRRYIEERVIPGAFEMTREEYDAYAAWAGHRPAGIFGMTVRVKL